jgi:predicted O-methyltransferase YrrM
MIARTNTDDSDVTTDAAVADQRDLPPGDYVSPGLLIIRPDQAFPHLMVGDTDTNQWPYLRREISHTWYVDDRSPTVGFCSRDEAAILYNTARQFANRPCLEIGCWRGWSTCHLALGSRGLHVIDPALSDQEFLDDVRGSLSRAGVLDGVVLHTGFSPDAVESLSTSLDLKWSLAFIDGDHEGDAPREDAAIVARYAADDALILFHDMASPHVAAGLSLLRQLGWHTMVYQTMQIMGVAWRGAVQPVPHTPDPDQPWTLPDHLASFPVSGENVEERANRFLAVLNGYAEQNAAVAALDEVAHQNEELGRHHGDLSRQFDDLHAAYLKVMRRLGDTEVALASARSQSRATKSTLAAVESQALETETTLASALAAIQSQLREQTLAQPRAQNGQVPHVTRAFAAAAARRAAGVVLGKAVALRDFSAARLRRQHR